VFESSSLLTANPVFEVVPEIRLMMTS